MVSAIHLEILMQVYTSWVRYDKPLSRSGFDLIIEDERLDEELKVLEISGLLSKEGDNYSLTVAGRSKFRVVLTGGAYDLIHRGHLITLQAAKDLADYLVVVVARDITVNRRKRKPIHSEDDRMIILNELAVVDAAVLGDEVDHMRVVRRIKPDVVALGADQHHIKQVLEDQIKDQGFPHTEIVRLQVDYEGLATTKVINEILQRNWE